MLAIRVIQHINRSLAYGCIHSLSFLLLLPFHQDDAFSPLYSGLLQLLHRTNDRCLEIEMAH